MKKSIYTNDFRMKYILTTLLIAVSTGTFSQSINYRAQGHYYSAKDAYHAKDYQEALEYIYKCKSALAGTNREVQYLHVMSAYYSGNYQEAQEEMNTFFQLEERKIERKEFDKSVETLTNDEVKALTKIINAVDESVEAEKERLVVQKETAIAVKREREAKISKIRNLNLGEINLATSKTELEQLIWEKVAAFQSDDSDVLAYRQRFEIKYGEGDGGRKSLWCRFYQEPGDLHWRKQMKLDAKLPPFFEAITPKTSATLQTIFRNANVHYVQVELNNNNSSLYKVQICAAYPEEYRGNLLKELVEFFGEPDKKERHKTAGFGEVYENYFYRDLEEKNLLVCQYARGLNGPELNLWFY